MMIFVPVKPVKENKGEETWPEQMNLQLLLLQIEERDGRSRIRISFFLTRLVSAQPNRYHV